MKKFIIILFLLLASVPTYAQYKPIPAHLSARYKKEIEQYLNKQYPNVKKEIEEIMSDATIRCNRVIQNPKNQDIYMDFITHNYESSIDSPEFYLYQNLINITKKYVKLSENDIPATDWSGALREFLNPYFDDNNINTTKLNELSKYLTPKYIQIEQLHEKTHRAVYPNEP